jgi:DNA-binding transcriptional MerR regulator
MDEAHLNRLSFIRPARKLGFPIKEVRQLLALANDRGSNSLQHQTALPASGSGGRRPKVRHRSRLLPELEIVPVRPVGS